MKFWEFIIVMVILVLAALLQSAFLPQASIGGFFPDIVFIIFFLIVFFEKPPFHYQGITSAVVAGFLLDVFLPGAFGLGIVLLLAICIGAKTAMYFLRERQQEYLLAYFIPLFSISWIAYSFLMYVFSVFPHVIFVIPPLSYFQLAGNIITALIVFYVFKYIHADHYKSKQLKLFR